MSPDFQAGGPLSGLRVLDLSRLLPGPLAGALFASMGAEVIKIESPREPDSTRFLPPLTPEGHSAYFAAINAGKRSLALDIRQPDAAAIYLQLVETADVVLESFRPGVLDALGVGYAACRTRQPGLVYASITGYGQQGPYAHRAGHDLNYMGYAGLLPLTIHPDGTPVLSGLQLADIAGGSMPAVYSVLAALWQKEKTGQGQYIDVSMTDGVRLLGTLQQAAQQSGQAQAPANQRLLSGGMANYGIYRAKDGGYMALAALEPKFWMRFCQACQQESWAGRLSLDPVGQDSLRRDLEKLFASQDSSYWTELGMKTDCCLTPVLQPEEVFGDSHFQHRAGCHPTSEAAVSSESRTPWISEWAKAPASLFHGTPASVPAPAPALGQDTEALLSELGIDSQKVEKLRESGHLR